MTYSYCNYKNNIRVATNRLAANYGLTFTASGNTFTDSTKISWTGGNKLWDEKRAEWLEKTACRKCAKLS